MATEAQIAILQLFQHPFRATSTASTEVGLRFGASPPTTTTDASLGYATTIPLGMPFSSFFSNHRRAARDLTTVFLKANSPDELAQIAGSVRSRLNELLFVYALSYAIMMKPALRVVGIPPFVEVFPNKFMRKAVLTQAQNQANMGQDGKMEPIIINNEFSGTLLKPEHRVSYWREDYGINSHHWHWHLVNPIEMGQNRDRKGELFYYMHQQMIARYDMERLSMDLNRVLPLNNLRIPIQEGYFSKLTINNSGDAWGTRQDNTLPQDVSRDDRNDSLITELETCYTRILDAVHQGFMIDRQRNQVPLSDDVPFNGKRGIDILGDAFEADPEASVNYPFYGDVHNSGHIVIAFAHDPDGAHREHMGVMGATATAMRDPVFYRWHKFIDLLFQEYKEQQVPYPITELTFERIRIDNVEVRQGNEVNNLQTGLNKREFDAGRGLDFNSPVPIQLRFTHLDHKPFHYHIQVTSSFQANKDVTVRIFLAPTRNKKGKNMTFMEQRLLWAEMDKFTVTLRPCQNQVVRASTDSTITAPRELTFGELEAGRTLTPGSDKASRFGACGCGWPQHLLLPRGNPNGMDFQLFFMITDWDRDRVEPPAAGRQCRNATSFCGILDAKYPDSRPMGFPFDRKPPEMIGTTDIKTAKNFADSLANAAIADIKITHQLPASLAEN